MGILRTNKISGLETPTPVTGSVVFDGSGDYLSLSDDTQFDFEAGNWTVEGWIYMNSLPSSGNRYTLVSKWTGAGNYSWICNIYNSSGVMQLNFGYTTTGSTATDLYSNGAPSEAGKWFHIAYVRDGSILRQFVNGVQLSTNSISGTIYNGSQNVNIGRHGEDTNYMNGYISNLRILKGTALYTSNFTPPVNELQRIGDTVLLCCNNPDSAGAEATGKTITVNGNAAASTFSPGLARDFTFGTQFSGVTKFDTQGYFVPPSGTTEQRGRGRGVFGGGDPGNVNTIAYINIQSTGNAIDFGDLTVSRLGAGGCSSSIRGIFNVGYNSPSLNTNVIDYITIASTGNAQDFGDSIESKHEPGACSSSTRGIFGGGVGAAPLTQTNVIEYLTIASTGNSQDFGDLTVARRNITTSQSPTRGIFFGGRVDPASVAQNIIDYITIASTGNAVDFGDLATTRGRAESVSSTTRAVCIGGENPTAVTTMEFITIATLGNTQNFGTASSAANNANNGASNCIRGVFHSAFLSPASVNTMEYVTIAATGNSVDFGDLTYATTRTTAFSDSHGGIS